MLNHSLTAPRNAHVRRILRTLLHGFGARDRIPAALVDQHVDAVRAIHREYGRSDAQKLATALTKRLREVTDDFLL
jgi:hypothetical protein